MCVHLFILCAVRGRAADVLPGSAIPRSARERVARADTAGTNRLVCVMR